MRLRIPAGFFAVLVAASVLAPVVYSQPRATEPGEDFPLEDQVRLASEYEFLGSARRRGLPMSRLVMQPRMTPPALTPCVELRDPAAPGADTATCGSEGAPSAEIAKANIAVVASMRALPSKEGHCGSFYRRCTFLARVFRPAAATHERDVEQVP
jgi:hypothetical protein